MAHLFVRKRPRPDRELVHVANERIGITTADERQALTVQGESRLNEAQTDLTNTALARSNAYVQVLLNLEVLSAATAMNLIPPSAE